MYIFQNIWFPVPANLLNKQSRTAEKVWSPQLWGAGRGVNSSSPYTNQIVTKLYRGLRNWWVLGSCEHGNELSSSI